VRRVKVLRFIFTFPRFDRGLIFITGGHEANQGHGATICRYLYMRLPEDASEITAMALKAAGHPERMNILSLLYHRGSLSVTEIHRELHLSQPAASRHLNILRNAGVLTCEKKTGHVFYFLNKRLPFLKNICAYLDRAKTTSHETKN
jgi:DNA-binding transcriptional ArsR family regulator